MDLVEVLKLFEYLSLIIEVQVIIEYNKWISNTITISHIIFLLEAKRRIKFSTLIERLNECVLQSP